MIDLYINHLLFTFHIYALHGASLALEKDLHALRFKRVYTVVLGLFPNGGHIFLSDLLLDDSESSSADWHCGSRSRRGTHFLRFRGLAGRQWQQQLPRHHRQGWLTALWHRLSDSSAHRPLLQWAKHSRHYQLGLEKEKFVCIYVMISAFLFFETDMVFLLIVRWVDWLGTHVAIFGSWAQWRKFAHRRQLCFRRNWNFEWYWNSVRECSLKLNCILFC